MSTAALMHDNSRYHLPPDAEPLSVQGYFCVVTTNFTSWSSEIGFHVVKEQEPFRHIFSVRITPPTMDYRMQAVTSRINCGMVTFNPNLARVCSEAIFLASELGLQLDESLLETHREAIERQRADRERREAEYRERQAVAAEERRKAAEAAEARRAVEKALNAERKELLQWHIGDKFRLTRRHHRTGQPMKAVVFGEINEFVQMGDRVVMLTTSEKGKPMRIYLDTIIKMDIKEHESDKRYSHKVIADG